MTRFIDYILDNRKIYSSNKKLYLGFSRNEILMMENQLQLKFPQYFFEYLLEMGKTPKREDEEVTIDIKLIQKELENESETFLPHQYVFFYDYEMFPNHSYYVDLKSDPIDPFVFHIQNNEKYKKFSDFLFSDFRVNLKENDSNIKRLSEEYQATVSQVLDHLNYERIKYPFTNSCVISTQSVAEFKKLLDWYLWLELNAPWQSINFTNQKQNSRENKEIQNIPKKVSLSDLPRNEQNAIKELSLILSEKILLENFLSWEKNGYKIENNHVTGLIINHIALSQSNLDNIFQSLPYLRILGLSGCQIIRIPNSIQNLQSLEFLNLSANDHEILPSTIGTLQNLRFLNLYCSNLTELPKEIGNLKQLQDLRLQECKFTLLPQSIGNLQNLQILDVSNNKLHALPYEFGGIYNLRFLGLSYNQLKNLPDSFGNLNSLEMLLCSNNQLETLPESFGNLKHLKYCTFDHNQLKNIPKSMGNLSHLRDLAIFHNQLENLPDEIGKLKRLSQLRLDHNKISYIPSSLSNIRPLQYLNLGLNRITHIPQELTQLKYLRDLNILGNPVEPLPDWAVAWRNQHPNYRY